MYVLGWRGRWNRVAEKCILVLLYSVAYSYSLAASSDPQSDFLAQMSAIRIDLLDQAQSGDPESQSRLGWDYFDGIYHARDLKKAEFWAKICAAQSTTSCESLLGHLLTTNVSVNDKRYSEGKNFLSKSAEKGDYRARLQLFAIAMLESDFDQIKATLEYAYSVEDIKVILMFFNWVHSNDLITLLPEQISPDVLPFLREVEAKIETSLTESNVEAALFLADYFSSFDIKKSFDLLERITSSGIDKYSKLAEFRMYYFDGYETFTPNDGIRAVNLKIDVARELLNGQDNIEILFLRFIGSNYLPDEFFEPWNSFLSGSYFNTDLDVEEGQSFVNLLSLDLGYMNGLSTAGIEVFPVDLVDVGWQLFVGEFGVIDEYRAQALTEIGLQYAIQLGEDHVIETAQNNLGVFLNDAVNPDIRNKELAFIHHSEGETSPYGPRNMLDHYYIDGYDFDINKVDEWADRYKEEEEGEAYWAIELGLGPEFRKLSLKNKVSVMKEQFDASPTASLAVSIAFIFEAHQDQYSFEDIIHWYEKALVLSASPEWIQNRINRIQLAIDGKVKRVPENSDPIAEIFDRGPVKPRFNADLESSEDRVALVIGNSDYGEYPLPNAVNDARSMAKILRTAGYEVHLFTNVKSRKFGEVLEFFSKDEKYAERVVFFYSGHAVQISGQNFLLPTDLSLSMANPELIDQSIELNKILRSHLVGANRVIFLDACRTGDGRSRGAGLAPVNIPRGTLISFSTKYGEAAFDGFGDSVNSPYTESLVTRLRENIDLELALRRVKDDVWKTTGGRQEPWTHSNLSGGEFILLDK